MERRGPILSRWLHTAWLTPAFVTPPALPSLRERCHSSGDRTLGPESIRYCQTAAQRAVPLLPWLRWSPFVWWQVEFDATSFYRAFEAQCLFSAVSTLSGSELTLNLSQGNMLWGNLIFEARPCGRAGWDVCVHVSVCVCMCT